MYIYYLTIKKKQINPCFLGHKKRKDWRKYETTLCMRCGQCLWNKKFDHNGNDGEYLTKLFFNNIGKTKL